MQKATLRDCLYIRYLLAASQDEPERRLMPSRRLVAERIHDDGLLAGSRSAAVHRPPVILQACSGSVTTSPPRTVQLKANIMNRNQLIALASLALLLQPAYAFSSMRCGKELVGYGDHAIEVLAKCGEPDHVEERVIYHVKKIDYQRPHARRDAHIQKEVHVPVQTETWVYNFGPNRFMQEARFVDGRLKKVRTLGRGYKVKDKFRAR